MDDDIASNGFRTVYVSGYNEFEAGRRV